MKGDKTKLLRGDGQDPQVFTEVAEIVEFGEITISRETTSSKPTFDSTDGYETVQVGAKKVEPFDLTLRWNSAALVAGLLSEDFESDVIGDYQIHWPDSLETKKQFSAFVTKVSIATPQDEDMTESFTFTVSGPFTDVT